MASKLTTDNEHQRSSNMAPTKSDTLGEIGTRGLVVHQGDSEVGTYSFFSDNEQTSWRTHRVDLGQFAQERGLPSNLVEQLVTAGVPVAVLKADANVRTYFVNLNAFHQLAD